MPVPAPNSGIPGALEPPQPSEGYALDTALVVIGLNHRTAPVQTRERFSVSEGHLYEALRQLSGCRAVEEVILLSTCNRTEYILWASDPTGALAAVREFLSREYAMTPAEWENFYSLRGQDALLHVFRVAASLDSMVLGESDITSQVKSAWAKAQKAGACGHFLDTVFQKALNVSKRVRNETEIGASPVSVPHVAVGLARHVFGSLEGRAVLVLGAGKMGETAARYLRKSGASRIWVASRTAEHAQDLAGKLGATPVPFAEWQQHLSNADIVISSTGCPHTIVNKADAQRLHEQRRGRPVLFIDIAVPRDVDPAVREISGVFLYDIDDLGRVAERNRNGRAAAAAEAEQLVAHEARGFAPKLEAERVVPAIRALRARLEEIRSQELERYLAETGPLGDAQQEALGAFSVLLLERIAGQFARELKQVQARPDQDHLAALLARLLGVRTGASGEENGECEPPEEILASCTAGGD